jgi:hypothetical protein
MTSKTIIKKLCSWTKTRAKICLSNVAVQKEEHNAEED